MNTEQTSKNIFMNIILVNHFYTQDKLNLFLLCKELFGRKNHHKLNIK